MDNKTREQYKQVLEEFITMYDKLAHDLEAGLPEDLPVGERLAIVASVHSEIIKTFEEYNARMVQTFQQKIADLKVKYE